MTDVFISYAKADRDEAQALATRLTSAGLTVWWDSELLSGEDFRAAILAKLREAKAVIVIWSHNAVRSHWVCEEAEEAAHVMKLIAVGAPGFNPSDVPLGLRSFQVVPIINRDGIITAITAAREGRLNTHNPLVRKTLLELWLERARRNAVALVAGAVAVLALSMPFWLPAQSGGLRNVLSSWSPEEQKLIDLATRLDREVQTATAHQTRPLKLDAFKVPLATIAELRNANPNNGNVFYYSSVIQRWLEPPDQVTERAHEGYFRYLEVVGGLSSAITQTGPDQSYCYSRPWGFCTQRTAWINHHLAWDYYGWAAKAAGEERRGHLRHVLKYGRASLCLRSEGFEQGKRTSIMVSEAERELGESRKDCPE